MIDENIDLIKLFAQSGYMGTSMNDIADKLGVTKAALYKHYKSKQEIFDSIVAKMNQMDMERVKGYDMPEDLFDISSEQLACVNGAEPGTGLIRFGDKIVPFDNTMEKDSSLYQLFNTNFHEMVKDKNVKQTVEK